MAFCKPAAEEEDQKREEGEKVGEEDVVGGDRRGGRLLREEDTVCCATITIFTLVRQLRQLCKKQQHIIVLSRNLQPLCWTKGDGGDLM